MRLLVCFFATAAQAQKPAPKHTQVGAGDIFAALTQPDRQAEIEALHAVHDALSGSDPVKLDAARAKLAEILQAEEHHQGDMPPALVMSGIASRIEAAMAGLEEARHAPPPATDRVQAFLVPGLAAVSAALGVALIACLAGLAARGRQAEAQEELQDTLKKIRRRLEAGAPAAASGAVAQDMASGEASEAVHQATAAVDRLGSAARDAEGRLQTCVGDAEARLHAAAAMAGQLEQWMESLPDRLAASVQAMEACGLPGIEAAAARIEESAERVSGLQDLLADYGGAVSGLTAQAKQSAEHLQRQVLAMHERFEALAGALPERVASAMPAAMSELSSAADLLAELSTLAIGQAGRMEDILARADKVASNLPVVAQALEQASAHLLGQVDQHAASSAASRRVAEDLADVSRLARTAAETLPERLAEAAGAVEARLGSSTGVVAESVGARLAAAADAMEARLAAGAERVQAQIQAFTGVVGETAGQVAKAAEAAGTRISGRAELLQAGLEQAALAVANAAATLPDIRDGLHEAAARLSAESAALLDAAAAPAASEGASGLAQTLLVVASQLETALGAAEALRTQAAEQAEAARARESDQVTTLFEVLAGRAEACLSALPSEAAALAATAAQLRGDAAELGASAMRIVENPDATDQLPAQAGVVLAALQTVCQRLEETVAAFGETGVALNEGVARIGRDVLRMQDESGSAQADGAAGPAVQDAQLAVLIGRLGALLEDFGENAAWLPHSRDADPRGQPLLDTLAAHPALIGLQAAADTVQRAAARLLESAQAQDAALARAGQAAAEVARLVATPNDDVRGGHALAGLTGIASLAESLQGEAESLAACVLRGDSVRIPAELISQMPVMLAAIETSIHRLRGTATALALASDGRLKAA